jgi:invasion protein IalB
MEMKFNSVAVILIAQTLLFPALAMAEDQKPPEPESATQQTQTEYGDWVLRCLEVGTEKAPSKVCEIAETVRMAAKQPPIAEIAISRFNKGDPLQLTAHVPANIALPSVVKFDYREAHGITLVWRRCAPAGCFADVQMTQEQADIFHVQTEPGHIEFYDSNGNPVKLAVSFRGLGDAMDALAKQ